MNISPFLTVDQTYGEVLHRVKTLLSAAGLRLVQTFDLHTARIGSHECACLNHGTEACDCQMVVMLVYGEAPEPATLILHGNNGQTWLSIVENPRQSADAKVSAEIKQALETMPVSALPTG